MPQQRLWGPIYIVETKRKEFSGVTPLHLNLSNRQWYKSPHVFPTNESGCMREDADLDSEMGKQNKQYGD